MITIRQGQSSPLRNVLLTEHWTVSRLRCNSQWQWHGDNAQHYNIADQSRSQVAFERFRQCVGFGVGNLRTLPSRSRHAFIQYSLTPMTPQFNCTITGDNWQGRSRVSPHISCGPSQQSAVCLFYDWHATTHNSRTLALSAHVIMLGTTFAKSADIDTARPTASTLTYIVMVNA